MSDTLSVKNPVIGIVGMGLMGSSIVASLLAAGHPVKAIAPLPGEEKSGLDRVIRQLRLCEDFELLNAPFEEYLELLTVSGDYHLLRDCELVVECIVEDIEAKEAVFKKIVACTSAEAILASNTSAIPISILQQMIPAPQRFIGIHWAEPAFATRFLEIICGRETNEQTVDSIFNLAISWGKEPTVLRKDIRGFITNRLMYAVYREILHLVEKKVIGFEEADKCFRYDAGSWMTLMGLFRRMDYDGLNDYDTAYRKIFPQLSNAEGISPQMQKITDAGSRGIQNGRGFYTYTQREAEQWSQSFEAFNKDIFRLAANYPERILTTSKLTL